MKRFLRFICFILILWILLFCTFLIYIKTLDYNQTNCKNIVVLTGDRGRIPLAIELIKKELPKNVFISGVHQDVTINQLIKNRTKYKDTHFILDKKSHNTKENAIEVSLWIYNNNISEIILITSDYHMPRSLIQIYNQNKNIKIFPYPLKSKLTPIFLKKCFKEFHKIIYDYCYSYKTNF